MGKIIWTSFPSKLWPCTIFSKFMTIEESPGQRGTPGGPPWGRPTQVQRLLGPTFSNGYLTIVPGSSSGALAQIPLNRGRDRGDELSCSLSTLTPSHTFLLGFPLDFDSSLIARTLSLSFLCCKIDHIFGGTTFG